MPRLNFKNNSFTFLAESITAVQDSFEVADASALPDVPFRLTILDGTAKSDAPVEIVEVGAKSEVTDVLSNVLRGREGTTATTHDSGVRVENRLTAEAHGELADAHIPINEQTGTSYTLTLTDDGKLVDCNNADPFTLTVPKNSVVAFPIGTQILVRQKGAGQVTIVPVDVDVTLNLAESEDTTRVQNSVAGLIKVATDTWAVFGDLEAGA